MENSSGLRFSSRQSRRTRRAAPAPWAIVHAKHGVAGQRTREDGIILNLLLYAFFRILASFAGKFVARRVYT
jgi:hypothetical protein